MSKKEAMKICPGGVLSAPIDPIYRYLIQQRTANQSGSELDAEGKEPCTMATRSSNMAGGKP